MINKIFFGLLGILITINIVVLLLIGKKSFKTQKSVQDAPSVIEKKTEEIRDELFNEINPPKGYELNVSYNDLGPKMIQIGVIDIEKFKKAFGEGDQSLTQEEMSILTKGSDKKIRMTRENAHFLLNFFWAVGLVNKSKVLTTGDMIKYGEGKPGNFASTGGWTLSRGDSMQYYAKHILFPLTSSQEDLVARVASHIYRPCCDNSTAFPDCNHGMALLGMLELLASRGATETEMYTASKYINSFWFPTTYYDIAQYFKAKENKDFKDLDGQVILEKEYSSASGYRSVKKWLAEKGIVKTAPQGGGSCGV